MPHAHPLGAALVHHLGEGAVEEFFARAAEILPDVTFICIALTRALEDLPSASSGHLRSLVFDLCTEITASLATCSGYGTWCCVRDVDDSAAWHEGRLTWLRRLKHYVKNGGPFPRPELP